MPQSLSTIYVHIVFSTKNRKPWLRGAELQDELYAYMAAILRDNVDSPALAIDGVDDHVHALVLLSRKFAIVKVVEEMKTETSKWLKRQTPVPKEFAWQNGYGAFSVSQSNVGQVTEYVRNQKEHHRKTTFKEEFAQMCRLHNAPLDERYVWD